MHKPLKNITPNAGPACNAHDAAILTLEDDKYKRNIVVDDLESPAQGRTKSFVMFLVNWRRSGFLRKLIGHPLFVIEGKQNIGCKHNIY
jgi:hypothetical protein